MVCDMSSSRSLEACCIEKWSKLVHGVLQGSVIDETDAAAGEL